MSSTTFQGRFRETTLLPTGFQEMKLPRRPDSVAERVNYSFPHASVYFSRMCPKPGGHPVPGEQGACLSLLLLGMRSKNATGKCA